MRQCVNIVFTVCVSLTVRARAEQGDVFTTPFHVARCKVTYVSAVTPAMGEIVGAFALSKYL